MTERSTPRLSRAALIALAAGGTLVVIVLGALGLSALRADDPEPDLPVTQPTPDVPDPADAVEDLLDAAADDDCDAAGALVTDALSAGGLCTSTHWLLLAEEEVETFVGAAVISGERATVEAALVVEDPDTARERASHLTFRLLLDGDEWVVATHRRGSTVPPTAVLDSFFHAVFDGDCDLATTYATQAYLDAQGECMATAYDPEDLAEITYEFGEPAVTGSGRERRAVVPVTLTNGDDVSTGDWELVVRQGEWRVHRLPR